MTAATAEKPLVVEPKIDTKDWPYEFEIVPIKHMIVDIYQRPLTSIAKEIEEDFEPALIGTLCLSERSKTKKAVIDGQNRMVGSKAHVSALPAVVYKGLTIEQEADLFAKFQTKRRGMTSASRFLAQVIAKQEPQVTIDRIVKEHGFFVEHNSSDPKSLKAVAALEFVYRGTYGRSGSEERNDPQLLADVLEVISEAWPGLPDTAKGKDMLRGLAWFLAREPSGTFKEPRKTEITMERLVDRLSRVTPSALAERAGKFRDARGMTGNAPVYLAEAINSVYSKR